MPQKRSQRNKEKLDALVAALESEGVLSEDWAGAIENINDHGQGREAAEAAREGRGPPSFTRGPGNGNGGN